MQNATPARPPRPQLVFEVVRTAWVTPHVVRVTLGGPAFDQFQQKAVTDSYVKLLFANPELGLEPPYDLVALRDTLPAEDVPVTRTYTVRRVNSEERTIDVDFVVHGDEGLAGPWAARVQAGERIALMGPGGAYSPDLTADWHLFAGDESALPAISAALESLPPDASGVAFLEHGAPDDVVDLAKPAGVEVVWVRREGRDDSTPSLLAGAVSAYSWPEGRVHVFAHGERESMKTLRDVFLKERGLEKSQLSLSGYWAAGRTEDRFQAEKREPIGIVLPA
ncbi:siderophore-interacting protein [Arthrobacter sp. JZ12]|uniref:siderophore-interacting protein n=1 Tax=Arthrobacter sp. JZ12 TaxID=2654190 RepID=UPI002B491E25|nr:siderophore-interacting protein [Arthrobacter sp. JZ12]WRH24701.1 siderophore-interacting protein [Arthrobacter sp. JZ12]